jgi:hypothetical protein
LAARYGERRVAFPVRRPLSPLLYGRPIPEKAIAEVRLEVRYYCEWDVEQPEDSARPALSSEDTPIEVLRAIEGFVEAPG